MGGDGAAAVGDQGAGAVHGLHGLGHEARLAVGDGEDGRGGGPADGTGREQIPQSAVGCERLGSVRPQLRQLGRVGFPREEVRSVCVFSLCFIHLAARGTTYNGFWLT